VYGHLESVLDEVRAGIGRVEEEQEDLGEATAAAAARLGVEPPASSPEESPRFPDLRPQEPADDGDGLLSATRPGVADLSPPEAADQPEQPSLPDAVDDSADGSADGNAESADGNPEATQPVLTSTTAQTTQPTPADDPAATTQPTPPAAQSAAGSANGEGGPGDQDATQRLEPVGNGGAKSRSSKPAAKEGKARP
jgi:hypothetical protein